MTNKITLTFLLGICFYIFTATYANSAKKKGIDISEITYNTLFSEEASAEMLYAAIDRGDFVMPSKESFSKAYKGYGNLKKDGMVENDLLTVIDFTMSSNEKRLWVIDMERRKILFNSYVAHGRNTGLEYADSFSNIPESFKSSIGFYATGETYFGKHGLSLRLDGLERGINDKARARAIVIHGADYATEKFIAQNGRLGRSLGCPALPKNISSNVIETIKDKSLLYIHSSDTNYEEKSAIFRG